MSFGGLFHGTGAICGKEFIHLRRDRTTVFFALAIPIVQLTFFGFAIDTNIRLIPAAVLDLSRTEDSRRVIERFVAADAIEIREAASNDRQLYSAIVAGRVKVGLRIPSDFARRLHAGDTAAIEVLVDGSDSTVTSHAVNTSTGIALRESLGRLLGPDAKLPIEARQAVLFNPGTRSPNFFVPGLVAIMLQMMVIMLVALSVVRERERGTLDQLKLSPVGPLGVMVGKMIPYAILAFVELAVVLTVMRIVFRVPIHGSLLLLIGFSAPFVLTILGLGLLISAKARSQGEAFQLGMATILPSVFLSGYIFLIQNMPLPFQWLSRILPATYFIEILRGVILRGAGFEHLWPHAAVLTGMGVLAIALAAVVFVKQRG
jgi:ABC-2 type transport system permease protein